MALTAKILSWRFRHLNIVGCLLKERPTKGGGGGGVTGTPGPPPPPLATPLVRRKRRREEYVDVVSLVLRSGLAASASTSANLFCNVLYRERP